MRRLLFLLLLSPLLLWGQDDCRIQKKDLKPVINTYNPFFTDHHWDDFKKWERAQLGPGRRLVISQTGCKRHHISILLLIKPEEVNPVTTFWIEETQALMYAIFFEDPAYALYRKDFDQAFADNIRIYGANRKFNFPLGSRNFVCEVVHEPGRGANLRIELVQYVFAEKIQQRGIPREKDDGWRRN